MTLTDKQKKQAVLFGGIAVVVLAFLYFRKAGAASGYVAPSGSEVPSYINYNVAPYTPSGTPTVNYGGLTYVNGPTGNCGGVNYYATENLLANAQSLVNAQGVAFRPQNNAVIGTGFVDVRSSDFGGSSGKVPEGAQFPPLNDWRSQPTKG